jgi:hypothetical protein
VKEREKKEKKKIHQRQTRLLNETCATLKCRGHEETSNNMVEGYFFLHQDVPLKKHRRLPHALGCSTCELILFLIIEPNTEFP